VLTAPIVLKFPWGARLVVQVIAVGNRVRPDDVVASPSASLLLGILAGRSWAIESTAG